MFIMSVMVVICVVVFATALVTAFNDLRDY